MGQRRRQRGQAVVETAVIAMFLVILILGVIGFGTIFQATIRCQQACREGARVLTSGGLSSDAQQAIMRNLTKSGNVADVPGKVAIALNPMSDAPGSRPFNSNVTVEIWWNYPLPVPLFNLIVRERMIYAKKVMAVTAGN